MKDIIHIDSVRDYSSRFGQSPLHPLVHVMDLDQLDYVDTEVRARKLHFNCYGIFLKGGGNLHIRYGRNTYDYGEGTLIFLAPGQVADISDDGPDYRASGQALIFHPDLLLGNPLHARMHEYTFFSYEVNEALHLSERERQIARDCFEQIGYELRQSIDKHSRKLVASILEMFLNYCLRFYDRQFITRDVINGGILERFEALMHEYYGSGRAEREGQPTVAFVAEQLNLSPNYFGDLIKKETGRSAKDHLQARLILEAKERIFDPTKTISEVAYELGFEYPQHFSRVFKKHTGMSPLEYRNN